VVTADIAGSGAPTGVDAALPPTLELTGVTVRFGGITALADVDLTVGRGEVLGLIGPNGAGKTTLFDVVSGVNSPNAGTVRLDGDDITRVGAVARSRRGLRRTFQRVQTFGWLTVEENVLAALEWRGGGGGMLADLVSFPTRRARERVRRERAREVIDQCGLSPVAHESAGSLPIGLARMVEVARAVVDRPRLLMLDEPTSGLDATESRRLGELIQSIRGEGECSVLLVEHDVGFVMEQVDRITVLDLGRVLAVGEPDEIQHDPRVRTAYLGES
jgi:ABC-type branched-subunit amino acid transport system ATPase component